MKQKANQFKPSRFDPFSTYTLNSAEASAFLGYNERHFVRMAREGIVPGRQFQNRRWYFDPAELREWVIKRERKNARKQR